MAMAMVVSSEETALWSSMIRLRPWTSPCHPGRDHNVSGLRERRTLGTERSEKTGSLQFVEQHWNSWNKFNLLLRENQFVVGF
jgi:hypothetical protein